MMFNENSITDSGRCLCLIQKAIWLSVVFSGFAVFADKGEISMTNKKENVVQKVFGAGRWFPAQKSALDRMVNGYIAQANVPAIKGRIVAAIAPHAGYVYSGAVAGYVFRALKDQAARGLAPDTVVILGLNHKGGARGVCLMDGDSIVTPLGETVLDGDGAKILAAGRPAVRFDCAPHQGEHSAENQVPFVQAALPGARLVMALVCDQEAQTLDALVDGLAELSAKRRLLVIASSDMLHDPDYDQVTRVDQASLKKTAALQTAELLRDWRYDRQIFCGMAAVAAAMRFAEKQGCRAGRTLCYRNSGDDYPESRGQWVVGYGAVVFSLPDEQ